MALIVTIQVNKQKLYTLVATRYPNAPAKGTNAYHVELYDEQSNLLKKDMVAHAYEDGAIKLVERMANKLYNAKALRSPAKTR